MIQTVDSDVVVISFGYAKLVKDAVVETFSVIFWPKETYFYVFDNFSCFGGDICRGLYYFYVVTRCDATPRFYQLGKVKFWKIWMKQHNNINGSLTRIFIRHGDQPSQWYRHYSQVYLQMLWSRYIFMYIILTPAFTSAVKYTRLMSLNTCASSSCDWATCKTCSYPNRVSLEAVSTGTRHTWCTKGSCYNCPCKKSGMNCMKFCKCEESRCEKRLFLRARNI